MNNSTKIQLFIKRSDVKKHLNKVAVKAGLIIVVVLLFSLIRSSLMGGIDPEKHIYFELVLLLLLAALSELAVTYLGIESVIVLMLVGILISPNTIDLIWKSLISFGFKLQATAPQLFYHMEFVQLFARIGAIILLFKVGLHSKIEKVFTKENLLVAVAGIIFPFTVGFLYATISGGNFAYSMFLGAALSATSVGVTVAVLKKRGLLDERFAEVVIGAAVIDDILSLLVLSGVINIVEAKGGSFLSVATSFALAILFIAGVFILGKRFITYLDKKKVTDRVILLSLAFVMFLSYIAEVINLSAIVGAFLAGIVLGWSRHRSDLEDRTYGLEILFTPIFFISLGILIDIKSIFIAIGPIIVISVIAILSKVIACGGTAYLTKLNINDSLIIGVGMVPRGEVALIIASIGLSKGILQQPEYAMLAAMAILTSIFVPTLLTHLISKGRAQQPSQ